jgi:O-antigen/teichoic acid export membrane protein
MGASLDPETQTVPASPLRTASGFGQSSRNFLTKRFGPSLRGRITPLVYALSSVATASAQLVSGVIILHWIQPADLGMWRIVQVAQVYSFLLLAGINNGLGRELPFFLGKDDKTFADRLAGTALFFVTVANVGILVCGVSSAILFAHHGANLVWAILAITCVIPLTFYRHILTITFRSKDSFNKLTAIQFVEAGLSLATVPLVYFFGYNGMLCRTVLIAGIIGLLIFMYRPMRVKLSMDWKALKLLLKTGLPIFGLDYMKNSAATVDRMVLMGLGGLGSVGLYQLAATTLQTLDALPTAMSTYSYTRTSFRYGQKGDPRELWHSGLRFMLLTVLLTALAAACGWLLLPYVVPIFASKYLSGLNAARIVLLAALCDAVTGIVANALLTLKSWKLLTIHQVASAMLFVLGPIVGVTFISHSLDGVAWGAVIGSFGRSISALILSWCATHRRPNT